MSVSPGEDPICPFCGSIKTTFRENDERMGVHECERGGKSFSGPKE
jgi:translation initiation factor 2 beta subunit (eIF-2beta)/eIF-5